MTPERWERLKPLFLAAIEAPSAERDAVASSLCGDDEELRNDLLGLLEAHDGAAGDDQFSPLVRPSLGSPAPTFHIGQILLRRFKIIRLCGTGGMGEAYEALDIELNQPVALKTIRAGFVNSASLFSRFKREVQLARRVSGPNVCRIHEIFRSADDDPGKGCIFLSMELLRGITLADKLRATGPLPSTQALPLAQQMCSGLESIHEASIVHRDLKTRNIMLTGEPGSERVILMDFGLAHDANPGQADDQTSITIPGAVMGTPEYMAPEQFEGKQATRATDIFALGIVLHEMVAGTNPFAASNAFHAAMLRGKRLEIQFPKQLGVPRHWSKVIAKCLEGDPSLRYSSANEVAQALEHTPQWKISFGDLRIGRRLSFFLLVVALVCVSGGLWWFIRQQDKPNPEAERWYAQGVAALHESCYVRAERLLSKAVELDPNYGMAHARLAEAWSNLDFDGAAKSELILATEHESRLSALDHLYLDAIRADVTRDFHRALDDYSQIARELPKGEEADGSLDLGLAFEHAGQPDRALDSFRNAAELDHLNPAPLLQRAILESRLQRVVAANRDFEAAESLYKTELNSEGKAELNYQRGYLANEREADGEAVTYLNSALDEARQMPSPQLEIRALTQLASVALVSGKIDEAANDANKAIEISRTNRLPGWAANALVRLATVDIGQHHLDQAEGHLNQAFELLLESQQDRVEAMANMTMASLRNQQHRSSQMLIPAQSAAAYYRQNGFVVEESLAETLIGRAQRDLGQWPDALNTAAHLKELAQKNGSKTTLVQSEELAGTTYRQMEDYPRARTSLESSFADAAGTDRESFEAALCANVLWRLGQFPDADRKLATVTKPTSSSEATEVESLLAQGKYQLALGQIGKLMNEFPDMPKSRTDRMQFEHALALAELGRKGEAAKQLQAALAGKPTPSDPADKSDYGLIQARIDYLLGDFQTSLQLAETAEKESGAENRLDTELRSSALAALAAEKLHDSDKTKTYKQKVVDSKAMLRDTWSDPDLQSYLSRHDLKLLSADIPLR